MSNTPEQPKPIHDPANPWGVIDADRVQTPDEIAQNFADLPEGLVTMGGLVGLIMDKAGEH